ncbi:hypothetical protein ASD15_01245 [Massilia sp. Root351]|nr:hypothetical protein ASD15_01245 [Massilia sp. Root351]
MIVPAALVELQDAAAFYTVQANAELGRAFVAEFERVVNLVFSAPNWAPFFAVPVAATFFADFLIASSIKWLQRNCVWLRLLIKGAGRPTGLGGNSMRQESHMNSR